MTPTTSAPFVSVIMPLHNEEKYVKEAIESIIHQTFTDFEFIIINDGSTDNSEEIIFEYTDERIIYLKNKKNIGISNTMNRGLAIAKGKYLVRMDADDISLPKRIETQVAFMEANPQIGACGTNLMLFGAKNKILTYKQSDAEIKSQFIAIFPLANATMIIRKSELFKLKTWYNPAMDSAEDFDLTERLSHHTVFANLPEVHYHYRIHASNSHLFHQQKLFELSLNIKIRNIEAKLKRKLTLQEKKILFKALKHETVALSWNELFEFHSLLLTIYKAMKDNKYYLEHLYSSSLINWWKRQLKKQTILRIATLYLVIPPLRFHWMAIVHTVKKIGSKIQSANKK